MFRPGKIVSTCFSQKDWLGLFVIACGVVVSCWILSILFSQTTRKSAMQRFQLASPSFASWAAQGPVPSMYNFENSIQFSNELAVDGPLDEKHESWFWCPVNHFPARCMTYGEFAPTWFGEQRQGTFEMSTRFRETELISRWEVEEQSDGVMTVRRIVEDWVQHDADD